MSQPPYSPYPQEPYSGQPSSGQPSPGPSYGQPVYGQPTSGAGYPPPGVPQQPNGPVYGTPSSGAPVYGTPSQPQYGTPPPQPQYGTPPQFGGPGAPPPSFTPPPRKKSSAGKVVLITLSVLFVLCAGGAGIVWFAAKDTVDQVIDASNISVSEPATLGGREKVTDPAIAANVSQLDTELSKVPGATGSVGAAYGDVLKRDLVMVAAASTLSGSPRERFDEFTQGMGQGGLAVDNMTDTDPGPLGGIAQCGDTNQSGVQMAICVWSDNGSIGMFAMLFKERADLEKEFIALRGEVEQKN